MTRRTYEHSYDHACRMCGDGWTAPTREYDCRQCGSGELDAERVTDARAYLQDALRGCEIGGGWHE